MSEKHSPLPWIAHDDEEWGYISIDDNEGRYAASVEYNDTDDPRFSQFWNKSVMKANAELIVKAVNAMPGLIKAAELAKEVLYDDYDEYHEEIKQIDQALAAAGVKP